MPSVVYESVPMAIVAKGIYYYGKIRYDPLSSKIEVVVDGHLNNIPDHGPVIFAGDRSAICFYSVATVHASGLNDVRSLQMAELAEIAKKELPLDVFSFEYTITLFGWIYEILAGNENISRVFLRENAVDITRKTGGLYYRLKEVRL